MDEDFQMFKIVIIGSQSTGKTNISTRYIKNQYNSSEKSTVGVEFLTKVVQVKNKNVKITIWDTAGQERYKSLSKVYYKGASGILIVYDVTEPQSYLDVQSWMRLANENLNLNDVVLMVVGNKVDLQGERKVSTDRPIKEYKQKFDIDCWEVSAKTGYNVKEVFGQLISKIYQKNRQNEPIDFGDPFDSDSFADPSSIVVPNRQTLTKPIQMPQVIQEVNPIYQEEEKPKKKPLPATNNNNQNTQKSAKKDNESRMTLTNKKDPKNEKKKGGCC